MIGFMQKHKKYFVVIVWVSSLAFLGAGFVGWGAYSFSSASNAVAVVGDRKITIDRLQREYARLYNVYNQLFNGTLDDAQAKQLGIEEQALNALISRSLMLNYAHDIGLRASREEILQTLTTMETFQNQGTFDAAIYKSVLADNQIRPKDFEEELGEGILLQKLDVLLEIPLTPLEIQTISAAVFSEDHIAIKILTQSSIAFNPTEEEVKKYWEENQDIYQTERGYEVLQVSINSDSFVADEDTLKKHYEDFKNQFLDENGQLLPFEKAINAVSVHYKASQAEKEALKEYIALRKGENKKAQSQRIYEGDSNYDTELLNLLSQAKEQETLKPIKTKEGFITIKIQKIIPSEPKSYIQAKDDATKDFTIFRKTQLLEEKANALLTDFKGLDVGYVSRQNKNSLAELNTEESQEFIAQLFNKNTARGYILLKDKAILYEILDQRLKNSDIITQNLDFLKRNGEQVKSRLAEIAFMEYLSNLYKVVRKL